MTVTTVGLMKGVGESITDADDAFLSMVGYTRTEFEQGAMNWREMTPPELRHHGGAARPGV